jgi:glyceraldehyde 3-phosphate dehydrogenase
MVNIGINAFGRVGRLVARALIAHPEKGRIVSINAPDLALDHMLYLLKYDSIHGTLKDTTLEANGHNIYVNGQKIRITSSRDPSKLRWDDVETDVLLECSGKFLTKDSCKPFLDTGAKKVIMSAPAKDDTPLFVYGVNNHAYKPEMNIISNSSCTTNCLAPLVKVIHTAFGLTEGLMTTVHATTKSQLTVDGASAKDWRAGRASGINIIPASTGAAKSMGKIMPELKGKLTGMAFRVPTTDVSVVDLTFKTQKPTTYEEICNVIKVASENEMKGILGYTDDQLVSTDIIHDSRSSIFDAKAGIALNPNFFKVIAWYDNEWGFCHRMVDMANLITDKK